MFLSDVLCSFEKEVGTIEFSKNPRMNKINQILLDKYEIYCL